MEAKDHHCVANLNPRGSVGRKEDHYTLLHTKYISCWPHGLRGDFFFIISLWSLDPRGKASLNPSGLIGKIYLGDH